MRKKIPALLLLLYFQTFFAQTVFRDYVDGQLYVKFRTASLKSVLHEDPRHVPLNSIRELRSGFEEYGITAISRPFYQATDDEGLCSILKVEFTAVTQVSKLIKALEQNSAVVYAEKVPVLRTDAVPNDPVFPSHLTQINATSAWNVFNGNSNITVAIVDDAIMWTHADLQANIYTNTGEIANNNIDDDNNGYVDDVHGYDVSDYDNSTVPTNTLMNHGTHCAGIAGACTNNGSGIAAIGWNIRIIPVKCQNDNGSLTGIANGYEGIIYAARAKARIISCSWGGSNTFTGQSVINYAWARGCLVIAAAGNSSSSTAQYPAGYNNVYCVAAVDASDIKSGYSNYGSWVDIAAPGNNINSTVPYTGGTPAYLQQSGTSMATPLVAGLAGLMLSKAPYMTPTDVINCISSTAVNIYSLTGNSSYASGSQLGAGRIDAYQAMNCAAGFLLHPPVAEFFTRPANSCTSTPVQFTDSSLYAPASWQWTFQGGTPATSTLSNPVVQWSTPGMYSVSLTVSNANGSSTKNKLSYITIAAPNALPFSEGFQPAVFPPSGWSNMNIGNDDAQWMRRTGTGGFGTSAACMYFDNFTYNVAGDRDEIRTPRFSFSNVAQARLRFDVAYAPYDQVNSDTLEIKLSTNCGVSWQSIYLKGGTQLATASNISTMFSPTAGQWRRDSIDISSSTAGQGSVMFSFVNHGQYGQPIYLDNINLAFPIPVSAMQGPSAVCVGATLSFTNQSTGAAAYSWSMTGAAPAVSSLSSPTVSYAAAGDYTVTLVSFNGTSTDTVAQTISINDYPTAVITSTNLSCANCGDGVLEATNLTGTAPFSFTWEPTGDNTALVAGLPEGCYTVTIDASGCVSSQSACVGFPLGLAAHALAGDLLIFPNPAHGQLTITSGSAFRYRLFSCTGQLLLSSDLKNKHVLGLDAFAAGIYFLEAEQNGVTVRKKILVN